MYDATQNDTASPARSYDETSQTEATGTSATFLHGDSDQTGFIANFIRDQPVLSLSLAFGLGLLVTSLMVGRRT
jgi:hypothetical protein